MKRKISLLTVILIMLAAVLALTGCSSSKKNGSNAKSKAKGAFVMIHNETGKKITTLQLKKSGDQDFGGSLLTDGKALKDGSKKKIKVQDTKFSGADKNNTFDVQLTYSDGSNGTLTAVPIPDVKKTLTIEAEDDFIYVKYISKKDNKLVMTDKEERKRKTDADTAKQAEDAQNADDQKTEDTADSASTAGTNGTTSNTARTGTARASRTARASAGAVRRSTGGTAIASTPSASTSQTTAPATPSGSGETSQSSSMSAGAM